MPFDAAWFDELRALSEIKVQQTRALGIDGYVPHVGELRPDGLITSRFLDETLHFVRLMLKTRYKFDTFFRSYERHMVNFPRGRAFHKQWNIAFTAGANPDEDHLRIGLGFRLSAHVDGIAPGIEEYLEFAKQVRSRQTAFNQTFQALGNCYELLDWEPPGPCVCENAVGALSLIIISDPPPLEGWRVFGKRLWVHDPQDQAIISSHKRLRDATIDIYERIRHAGFGM
jgi:hypothetical protein